jgi:hypothetical protein
LGIRQVNRRAVSYGIIARARVSPLHGLQREFCSRFAPSGGDLESDSSQKCIQIVSDPLVKAIALTAFLFDQNLVSADSRQQTGSEWRIDALEKLEEDQADRIALVDRSIVAGVRRLDSLLEEISRLLNAYAAAILTSGFYILEGYQGRSPCPVLFISRVSNTAWSRF